MFRRDENCRPSQAGVGCLLKAKTLFRSRTKRRQYLEENYGALGVTLSTSDLARIEEVAAAGQRYAET